MTYVWGAHNIEQPTFKKSLTKLEENLLKGTRWSTLSLTSKMSLLFHFLNSAGKCFLGIRPCGSSPYLVLYLFSASLPWGMWGKECDDCLALLEGSHHSLSTVFSKCLSPHPGTQGKGKELEGHLLPGRLRSSCWESNPPFWPGQTPQQTPLSHFSGVLLMLIHPRVLPLSMFPPLNTYLSSQAQQKPLLCDKQPFPMSSQNQIISRWRDLESCLVNSIRCLNPGDKSSLLSSQSPRTHLSQRLSHHLLRKLDPFMGSSESPP
jgi:hypothetical protein